MTVIAKNPWFLGILVLVFAVGVFLNIPIEKRKFGLSQTGLTTDFGGLLPEKVERVVKAVNRTELQKIVKEANDKGYHISIAGLQHSHGGHTYYKDGVVLDMRTFNKILEFDQENKTIRVEAGAAWKDVQEVINPYGLALKVTQSQADFTIGGSLSVNAHGRDIRFGPMASTVKEMTLLTPSGDIKTITRDDEEEWMKYVFGGYGLFGVILDVTLELTENKLYTIQIKDIEMEEYESYFANILKDETIDMHYARISVAPSTFLEEMYIIDYKDTGKIDNTTTLREEKGSRIGKLALDLGREGGLLEDFFWKTQKHFMSLTNGDTITRNNVMRAGSHFMEFTSNRKVEVLQEYFVPVDAFEEYITDLKDLLQHNDKREDFKVHNITIRYGAQDDGTSLNYARKDMLGFVILIQHGVEDADIKNAQAIIQDWTDLTLKHGGTYYLPYYPYQTKEQFHLSYPNWEDFQLEKEKRDPNTVFRNLFYDHYIK